MWFVSICNYIIIYLRVQSCASKVAIADMKANKKNDDRLTSSLRLETSNTFDIPLIDVGFVWPMPWVVANANAPRLGIAFPYAPVVNGVPKPKANGGITLGAPMPFTLKR